LVKTKLGDVSNNAGELMDKDKDQEIKHDAYSQQQIDSDESDDSSNFRITKKSKSYSKREGVGLIHQLLSTLQNSFKSTQISDLYQLEATGGKEKLKDLFNSFISNILETVDQVHSVSKESEEDANNGGSKDFNSLCNDFIEICKNIFENQSINIVSSVV
jgi:hypothetical protein